MFFFSYFVIQYAQYLKIAKDNGRTMLTGRLVCDDTGGINQRGRLGPLLSPPLRNTSLLLWFIWYKIKLKLSYLLLHYFFIL